MSSPALSDRVLASADAGAPLGEIERELIEPARLAEDEKAAMWLLAWSHISHHRPPRRFLQGKKDQLAETYC